jgi:hypothetical protein
MKRQSCMILKITDDSTTLHALFDPAFERHPERGWIWVAIALRNMGAELHPESLKYQDSIVVV